ncbi:hypothetical protein [Pseudomonas sp. MYb185]|uniref:hypothetical protein n=1 Tax=Pseudomonas sp. MYb185 TaxID=1848729 RepID=UPI000CFDA9A3|nr:hypothetical protein [Pseudomonas sp. MYb185]PRB79881.1 hypothetical protein CQ007_14865 [Pseudomonas sp. MYb185]
MKYLLLLLFLVFAAQAHADAQQAQNLHELRSEGYRAATFLLIDNNLFERVREPGNREAYNAALANMEKLLRLLDNPSALRTTYNEFVSLIRELENQTQEEAHYHLATVNRIMMAHAELDKAAAAQYSPLAGEIGENLHALHQQSLETSQILLLYQNSMFSSIGVYFIETGESVFQAMDASIIQRSATLKSLLPDMSATLNDLDKQYSFIQPRLLNHRSDWVPTIAAFYLLRNTETLNDLAREQVRQSKAS